MPIQDDQAARVMAQAPEADAVEAGDRADDLRAILKLIASQLQDADRRQSEVLDDMHRRLAQMGNDARVTRARVPDAFAPAFERIQDGIELLAQIVASADAQPSTSARNYGELESPSQGAGDFYDEISGRDVLSSVSSIFPTSQPEIGMQVTPDADLADAGEPVADEFDTAADDMMITDNAADRFELDDRSEFSTLHGASEYAVPSPAAKQPDRQEPPVFASPAFAEDSQWESGEDWDEVSTWNPEEADALARVYEAHDEEDAARAAGLSHERTLKAEMLAQPQIPEEERHDDIFEPTAENTYGQEDIEMLPQEFKSRDFHQAGVGNVGPAIEQAWLEERFAEIAAKIEESILELRDDQTLNLLSDRFGDFEERIGLALEDVATRQDVDALRSAESQIDAMVTYFERIEAQLGRVDSLEAQMEALLERFSDENIAQLLPAHASVQDVDYSGLAEAAAENVAQRFLSEFAGGAIGGEGDREAIADMREALEAFAAERRERDEESVNMLDTIQQALLRVLDRVEELEQAYERAPMAPPFDDGRAEAGSPDSEESDPYAYEAEHHEYDAPGHEEPRMERQRPERDYQQARLEYPAVVRPQEDARRAAPQVEPDYQNDEHPHRHDVNAFDQDALNETAGEATDEQVYADEVPAAEEPMQQDYEAAQSHHFSEAQTEPHIVGAQQAASASPIDRLRQEFIADARRARERASQQAALHMAQPAEVQPAKSRFSLPGLSSLTAKVRGLDKAESPAAAPAPVAPHPAAEPAGPMSMSRAALAARAQVVEDNEPAPSRSRFALPRSKLLVGAAIVLFATAGLLLIMRSPSKPITEAAPPAIEQTLEQTPSGPELSGPEITTPGTKGVEAPDRRSSLDGGRVYDGEFNYDAPNEDTASPMDRPLAGLAVTDLDKAPDPVAYAKVRSQQRVAKMSSDLGAAAAYAVPATLIEEQPANSPAAAANTSVARAGDDNHLDLPPATVGPLSLRLAAAKGDPSAQFEVAARLAGGTGTQQDLKGAVKWYQLAASQGFAQAQYRLGTLYERGLGVDKDLARSSVWYQRAAAKGNVKAMHNLAVVSAGRTEGGPDYATAAKWFDAAAQYGLSDSQFNMAVLYENGLGVETNLTRAYVNYSLAAAKGDQQAKTRRDAVGAMLTNSDLETAERQVQSFRPKTADRLVNDARVAGEDWKKRAEGGY